MSLELYADETGTNYKPGNPDNAPVMGIAGYIAYTEDWGRLNVEWKKVLDEFKVDKFHFYEFANRKRAKPGQRYCEWTEDHAGEFLAKLSIIAGTIPRFGFAALVSVKDYDKKLPQLHKDLYGHPYNFCLHLFLNMVLDELKDLLPGSQYSLYLDDSQQFKKGARKVWDWVKYEFDTENRMTSKPEFKNSLKCFPLQAADLLAYRMRQALNNQLRDNQGFKKIDITQLDKQLGAEKKLIVKSYGGKHLAALVQRHVKEVLRDHLAAKKASRR